MIIYPAIDIRGSKVVRLREGDPNQQTTFSDNPVQIAQQWIDSGAKWLHVVNLDGAFSTENDTVSILESIAKLPVKVQFGGGLRSMEHISRAIEKGAARVVLGTVAIEQPELVSEAIQKFGAEAICVGLDARDGKITTHGWTTLSEETPESLGLAMTQRGVKHALFTSVNRDGGLTGSAVEETIALGKNTGLQVIASGGVTTAAEVTQLSRSGHVAGAIIGMALYQGKITLEAALQAVQGAS